MATDVVSMERVRVRPYPYRRAGTELWRMLDAISAELGQAVALRAARELVDAAYEGRITGDAYKKSGYGHDCIGCAVGTIAVACGYDFYGVPAMVPGWKGAGRRRDYTPLETHVWDVEEDDTPATSEALGQLVDWTRQWAGARGVSIS